MVLVIIYCCQRKIKAIDSLANEPCWPIMAHKALRHYKDIFSFQLNLISNIHGFTTNCIKVLCRLTMYNQIFLFHIYCCNDTHNFAWAWNVFIHLVCHSNFFISHNVQMQMHIYSIKTWLSRVNSGWKSSTICSAIMKYWFYMSIYLYIVSKGNLKCSQAYEFWR